MKLWRFYLLIFLLNGNGFVVQAQDYHAIQGSNHAGSLGVHNNPASILNTPYPWDITVAGIQAKYQTNAISVVDYSLLSSPYNSKFIIGSGYDKRFGNAQFNLNLLNGRMAMGRKKGIAFGASLKSFSNIKSGSYNFIDTIGNIDQFFSINPGSEPFNARVRSSTVLELYGAYAQTIWDNAGTRLNAGLTVKVNRGLSGARAEVADVTRNKKMVNGQEEYVLTGGSFTYGYSSNYDRWDDKRTNADNLRDFLQTTRAGFSFDAGFELIVKPPGEPGYMEEEESWYDYEWKLGVSVVDIGWGQYRYGVESRRGIVPEGGVTGSEMDNKLGEGIDGLAALNDSLSTMFPLAGTGSDFRIFSPGRMVLNADRYLYGAWYLNAEMSINLVGLLGDQRLYVKNMNLLRLTPRWEIRRWGVYLPLLLNTEKQFWIGAGFKAGPLLLGFHNLGNLFGKNKMASGGGYLALVIRPGKAVTGAARWKKTDCYAY